MSNQLERRVERLETESGDNRRKFVWLDRGDEPKATKGEGERIVYVSWSWQRR